MDENNMVDLEIELEDNELQALMKIANDQNITFNQLVNNILAEAIEKNKRS